MQLKSKYFIILSLFFSVDINPVSAVTYTFNPGRFGDRFISYFHAKWVSYVCQIPLLYKPFYYSDQLMLHEKEMSYDESMLRNYKKVIYIDEHSPYIPIEKDANYLYVIKYFSESLFEQRNNNWPFPINWKDEGFINQVRALVQPRCQLNRMELPKDCISVAVHVRKGTGFDYSDLNLTLPHKCPPDSYYVEQINYIAQIFADRKLYIYLFTDHDKPLELVEKYKSILNNPNITFDCRTTKNVHDQNVLEDFFSFTQFDCLVRPESNFSFIAGKLKDYKIQIAPEHFVRNGNQITIDRVSIEQCLQ